MLRATYLREAVLNSKSLVHTPTSTIDSAALLADIKVANSVGPLRNPETPLHSHTTLSHLFTLTRHVIG